jgi:thiol-disulfide isomerase/thioredoxin
MDFLDITAISRRLSPAAVLLLVLSFAPAGAAAEQVTAEQVARMKELLRDGQSAFEAESFAQANRAFEAFLALLPPGAAFDELRRNSHYYVACGYARLDQAKPALEHLDRAMRHGYLDFDAIERDPDLANVRGEEGFRDLLERYRKQEDEKLQRFDFELTSLDGKVVSKAAARGKVLLVNVWGTWCPSCRLEVPHFVELAERYGKQGLEVVGLSDERLPTEARAEKVLRRYVEDRRINYPNALITPAVLAAIPDFKGYPTTLVVNREGRIVRRIDGFAPLETLEEIVLPLLAEKAPQTGGGGGGDTPASAPAKD